MTLELFIEFLKTYYREIIDISVLIISVVICLIRKRPTYNEIDSIKKDILEMLPSFINLVETDGNGAQKKSTVMSLVKQYVKARFKIDLPEDIAQLVDIAIEDILSTPTKKKG